MTYITIRKETKNWWEGIFQPRVLSLMAYIESIEDVEFETFHYVMWTDELNVDGTFHHYSFNIFMEWGGNISLTFKSSVPEDVITLLDQKIQSYKYLGRKSERLALKRFELLSKRGN